MAAKIMEMKPGGAGSVATSARATWPSSGVNSANPANCSGLLSRVAPNGSISAGKRRKRSFSPSARCAWRLVSAFHTGRSNGCIRSPALSGRAMAPGQGRSISGGLRCLFMTTPRTLKALNRLIAQAEPLTGFAARAVLGEGPLHPDLALVGEQPGDQEEMEGHPFVGPAGKLLNRALADAGIDRAQVYVTNAVKHFKYEQRGKRRLHSKPNAGEVKHYRWWLE